MTNNNRVFNFSAGPSMLPLNVIEDAAANLASYEGCGQSVMEMSHRSKEFGKIIEDAEANLREIMNKMCIRDSLYRRRPDCPCGKRTNGHCRNGYRLYRSRNDRKTHSRII